MITKEKLNELDVLVDELLKKETKESLLKYINNKIENVQEKKELTFDELFQKYYNVPFNKEILYDILPEEIYLNLRAHTHIKLIAKELNALSVEEYCIKYFVYKDSKNTLRIAHTHNNNTYQHILFKSLVKTNEVLNYLGAKESFEILLKNKLKV